MKKLKMAGLLGLMLGLSLNGAAVTTTNVPGIGPASAVNKMRDPALSKLRYDMIMGQLDAGGDLLLVANLDGLIKSGVDRITQPILLMGKEIPDSQAIMDCVAKIPGFLDKNGFYALQGIGMSVVPRADGLNAVKCFVARDPVAAELPLWRALVGTNPKIMECTDFLPADTEFARTGTAEWRSLWKLIRAGVVELGTPAAAVAFDKQLATLTTNMGVNLDKVFNSFSGESFFSVQLSKTATSELPGFAGKNNVSMPQPSFLLGMAVTDKTMVDALEAALAKVGMMAVANEGEWSGVKTLNLPMPLPIPFQPSYTVFSNVFLFGSTPAVVQAGINAYRSKGGLTSTPQFKKAFEGLPVQNNGIEYVSSRFMNTYVEVQKAYMCSPGAGNNGMADVMTQILSYQQNMQSAMVIQNRKNGVLTIGNSSVGGKEMIASMIVAPVGLLAGIAIPSFMKAKIQSGQNACINNLRQLESAKEQWALAGKKNQGDAVVEAEVLQYIKGNKMPVCPQGGQYTLNAIGENCECSLPGHKLAD